MQACLKFFSLINLFALSHPYEIVISNDFKI